MKENREGGRRNASNEASFPSLFNIELMLSCVMKRSQTLRYSTRGSRRVSGGVGLCESIHTMPLSVWTAQPAMVRFSLTYPVTTPFTTRYAPGLQKRGGPGPLHISFFKLDSSEKRPVWWPCGQIYLSCSGKHSYILPRMNIIHLRLVQRITCSAHACSLGHMSQALVIWAFTLPQRAADRHLKEEI